MDNHIVYAIVIVVIAVILEKLYQNNIFVKPVDLEKKHREILNDVSNNYVTKESHNLLDEKVDDLSSKMDKITTVVEKIYGKIMGEL